jgi:hypothetical protein
VNIAHGIIGFPVDLMKAKFGWVKALHTRISSSVLYRSLSFQRRTVQRADHCIYAVEVFSKGGAVCIFGIKGLDRDIVLLLEICVGRDECDDFECMSRSLRRSQSLKNALSDLGYVQSSSVETMVILGHSLPVRRRKER